MKIRIASTMSKLALASMLTLGSVTGVMAQATATPGASPAAAAEYGSPVDIQNCWDSQPDWSKTGYPQWSQAPGMKIDKSKSYYATVVTNRGTIVIQLYADVAPNAVNNFVCLAEQHYYDGVTFHRVMRDFMIQTGDPTGTGRGGPGYQFGDELPGDDLTYVEGSVAMANAGPNTNGSQFFINHKTNGTLPKNYTIFGQVVAGMDVVNKIAEVPVGPSAGGEQSVPAATITILSVDVSQK